MCRRANCPDCGRPTVLGCGAHVEQVLGDVPLAERCRCREASAEHPTGTPAVDPWAWLRALLKK